MICAILWGITYLNNSNSPFWKKFFKVVPALFLCYFIPSLLSTFGIVDITDSKLYWAATRILLPAGLFLLTISVDVKKILALKYKALVIFLSGTLGIIIGGPVSLWLTKVFFPDSFNPDLWRGMATVAGSWIGGGANQAAMKVIFKAPDEIFGIMLAIDTMIVGIWLALLFFGVGKNREINKWLQADESAIEEVKKALSHLKASTQRVPTNKDFIFLVTIPFVITGLAHLFADWITPVITEYYPELNRVSLTSSFFWMIMTVTIIGIGLSFTKIRRLDEVGASQFGNLLIYLLVVVIGLNMDLMTITKSPELFFTGLVWMLIHGLFLLITAKIIKAPYFFVAVGSQANVGGAASAPIVASAFHPSLAPVGVLLAVLGYAIGTVGAYTCGLLMKMIGFI